MYATNIQTPLCRRSQWYSFYLEISLAFARRQAIFNVDVIPWFAQSWYSIPLILWSSNLAQILSEKNCQRVNPLFHQYSSVSRGTSESALKEVGVATQTDAIYWQTQHFLLSLR